MGVRFGAFNITVPALIRPAPRALAAHLWALSQGSIEIKGLDDILHLAASGRTSIPVNVEILPDLYRAAGFRVCGTRAVRVDILERLADLIRPAISYRPGITQGEVPAGAADGDGFIVTTAMTSLCGCAGEDFATILRALGYAMVSRPGPALTIAPKPVEAAPEPASSAAVDLQDAIMADALANLDEPAPEQTPSEESAPSASAAEPAASELASPAEAVADAPAAEAAPEMVEIWRPQRQQRHAPRPDRKKQFQRPATQTAPAPADGEAPRPREERRSFGADKEGGEGRPRHGQRPPRRDGEAPSGEKRSFPKRDGANRPDNGGRPGKSFSGKPYQGKGGQSSLQSAPPREVERKPDPDSPFAKLLALKAELEARNTKG
jgi:ATP-dependent RNA helicase SUPV3L1/SUV3